MFSIVEAVSGARDVIRMFSTIESVLGDPECSRLKRTFMVCSWRRRWNVLKKFSVKENVNEIFWTEKNVSLISQCLQNVLKQEERLLNSECSQTVLRERLYDLEQIQGHFIDSINLRIMALMKRTSTERFLQQIYAMLLIPWISLLGWYSWR